MNRDWPIIDLTDEEPETRSRGGIIWEKHGSNEDNKYRNDPETSETLGEFGNWGVGKWLKKPPCKRNDKVSRIIFETGFCTVMSKCVSHPDPHLKIDQPFTTTIYADVIIGVNKPARDIPRVALFGWITRPEFIRFSKSWDYLRYTGKRNKHETNFMVWQDLHRMEQFNEENVRYVLEIFKDPLKHVSSMSEIVLP